MQSTKLKQGKPTVVVNPTTRQRINGVPVGLKNVGNSKDFGNYKLAILIVYFKHTSTITSLSN